MAYYIYTRVIRDGGRVANGLLYLYKRGAIGLITKTRLERAHLVDGASISKNGKLASACYGFPVYIVLSQSI